MPISSAEFAKRRRQLMRMMGKGGIAILTAAPVRFRSRDVEYPYRQDSDFLYLTGFGEPESVAVLVPGRHHGEFIMFCRERDPAKEIWDGARVGPEGLVERFGADDAFPIGDIDDILPGLMEQCDRVYHTMGVHPEFDSQVIDWVKTLRVRGHGAVQAPQEFVALDHYLHDMRLYKSRSEVSRLRRAARIAQVAHARAMQMVRPGLMEYEVLAELLREFHRQGASASYSPIVGGGANSCILHYVSNDAQLKDGDLLLVDAGCEYQGYASDVTRTYPVNGRFSDAQLEIYEIVLEAQNAAIDKVRAGNHWNDPHDAAVRAITRGLRSAGLLKGTLPRLLKTHAYQPYFMHRTGHWLGLDVHDVGDYRVGPQWRLLEPGMVMTIEPGVYLPAGASGLRKRWANIGVRIEDDVLVTRGEPDVLSGGLVKDPQGIEALIAPD